MRRPASNLAVPVTVACIAWLLTWLTPGASADTPVPPAEQPAAGRAFVIVADGMVDNVFRDGIKRRYERAVADGADAVVIEVDTYGGLVTAGLETSRFLKQANVPVHAFVREKAISAGAMIVLAADSLAMQPASQMGDSGVIAMGQGELGETERAKAESPVLADFDDSARRNGYSPLLARSFVRTAEVVYALEHAETAEVRFVDADGRAQLLDDGDGWADASDVPVPLVGPGELLTLSDTMAVRLGISVGTFANGSDFARHLGYDVVAVLEPSPGERVIGFLGSFAVRGVLMTLLLLSVYASFSQPGTGPPEAIAAVCLGVLFGVPMLTGFAEWYEIAFVLLGLVLIAVEVFVLPGFGVFGITGVVSLVIGFALTFVGPIAPPDLPVGFGIDWTRFLEGLLLTSAALAVSLMLWVWLARFLPSLPYANRMILADVPVSAQARAYAAAWPGVGAAGVTTTDLRPGGTASFAVTDALDDTALADVVCDRGFVAAGTRVVVVEAAGNRVVVRPVEDVMRPAEGGA